MTSNISLAHRRAAGVTLVELLIAITLALLVMLGLVTLMNSVGVTNRTQDGMARVQENGRYALQRIAQDIRAATGQYCSTFGAASSVLGAGGYYYLDSLRAPYAHYDLNAAVGLGPTAQTAGYLVNPRWMLFGSDCDASTCSPAVNAANRGFDTAYTAGALATMGITNGARARGADVLTLRWLDGAGSSVTALRFAGPGDGAVQFDASATELNLTGNNQQVWLTDCSVNELLRVNVAGNTFTASGNFNATESERLLGRLEMKRDPRVYNVTRDLRQVSYMLRVNDDPDPDRVPADRKIVSLLRVANGAVQELVQGVERLDFLYAVENAAGGVQYLTAAQVDALSGAACDPAPSVPSGLATWTATSDAGCGWRKVRAIEVAMLLNTVTDAAIDNNDQFRYSLLNDGTANTANAFESPQALGTLRNGLPPYRMMRREFRTLVNLRGYNY